MSPSIELEFVLVTSDYSMMHAVSDGVKRYGGKFVLLPAAESALDYLNRRKTDGVFLDMEVPGAIGLIEAIRRGTSNRKAVIFACGKNTREYTMTLNAGANFLLRKPLSVDSVSLHITIAQELLVKERRRYFRHPVNLPVVLKEGEAQQRARITNLSEGGMAVHTIKPISRAGVVEFEFQLPLGMTIKGKGQVAWINVEGMAGIAVQAFEGKAKEYLESWLMAQEGLASNPAAPKP
jgi:response regulator RpfG family c-di-GMP phosphodiesterase